MASVRPNSRRKVVLVALAAVVILLWFAPAALRPLTKTDEGRYAEIPREMLRSGDFVTPRLNGFLYFEKPPLQYWATAAAYAAFGLTELSARLWTALTGLLGIVLVGWAGRRLFGREAGLASALILAGSPFWLLLGRVNSLDMGVTFFLTVALVGFCLGQAHRDDPRRGRTFMLICWAGMALAVLSKGLMGVVLPGGALVVYTMVQRDTRAWRHLHLGKGLLLFLAITVPWFVLVSIRNPSFPHFFFIHEHLERFLTKEHKRYAPPYWFVPVIVGGMLPWLFVASRSAARGWKREAALGTFDARRMIWIWTAFVFLFFSASSSKLIGYVGPCFPGLALLAGEPALRVGRRALRATAGIAAGAGAVLLLGSPFASRLSVPDTTPEMLRGTIPYLAAAGAVLVLAGIFAWRSAGRGSVRSLAWSAGGWFAGLSVLLLATIAIEPSNSSRSLAAAIRPHLAPGVPVYTVDRYDQSLPFYLDRTVTLVKLQTEMRFGIGEDPSAWIPTVEEWRKRWRADDRAIAVVNGEDVAVERARGLPFRVIWPADDPGGERRAVIVKP